MYFHRYFALRSVLEYNLTAFGLGAVLIGEKVLGLYGRNHDFNRLVSKGYEIRLGRKVEEDEAAKYKKEVLAYEFETLKFLKFDLYARLPYSVVKEIALEHKDVQNRDMKCLHEECVGKDSCRIVTKAFEFISNACYSNALIMFQPRQVAAAAYYLAKRAMKMPCTPEGLGEDPALIKKACFCILTESAKALEYVQGSGQQAPNPSTSGGAR